MGVDEVPNVRNLFKVKHGAGFEPKEFDFDGVRIKDATTIEGMRKIKEMFSEGDEIPQKYIDMMEGFIKTKIHHKKHILDELRAVESLIKEGMKIYDQICPEQNK